MSDFHLPQWHEKSSSNPNNMTKTPIKSEKRIPYGGVFSIMSAFERLLSPIIDKELAKRDEKTVIYSKIISSMMCAYLCGDTRIENITSHLIKNLLHHPNLLTAVQIQHSVA